MHYANIYSSNKTFCAVMNAVCRYRSITKVIYIVYEQVQLCFTCLIVSIGKKLYKSETYHVPTHVTGQRFHKGLPSNSM